MIKVDEVIVVEGKYDKIKLSSFIDGVIIETNGFGVFKDRETKELIRKLAKKKGIIVLTDSDTAGFKIRNYVKNIAGTDRVKHAYIPDILGKESRKRAPSAENKLGVEGVPRESIEKALQLAQAVVPQEQGESTITKYDLYEDGLYGGAGSREMRSMLLRELDLPQHLSANMMPQVLSCLLTKEEYQKLIVKIKNKQ